MNVHPSPIMICRPSVSSAGSYFVIVIVSQVARLRRGIDIQFNTFSITTPAGVDEPENLVHLGAAATHATLAQSYAVCTCYSLSQHALGMAAQIRVVRGLLPTSIGPSALAQAKTD